MRILAVAIDPRLGTAAAIATVRARGAYDQLWALGYHAERPVTRAAADTPVLAAHSARWWQRGAAVRDWPSPSLEAAVATAARGAVARGHTVEALVVAPANDDATEARGLGAALEAAGVACAYVDPTDPDEPVQPGPPPVVWLDTETNGKQPEIDAIIEVAALQTDSGCTRVERAYEAKIALPPHVPVDIFAAEINGYDPAAWVDAREEEEVIPELFAWLPPVFTLAGFNVSFDRRGIRAAANRLGLPEPGWREKAIDPLFVARKALRHLPHHRLVDLCEYFGISNEDAHRAMSDVLRSRLVYLKLLGKEPIDE